MNIVLTYQILPFHIRALTHENEDGSYTILINTNLCHKRQMAAVLHELTHIQGNDFTNEEQADLLEKMIHTQKQNIVDLSEFEFFIA
ncbi:MULTISPECIES: hypothetical protein [unclassified Megasphaera]|uniref:hypothetical protein n=1 Tax=unclassified Megasphaera TaxID=2626256 RepID=UPI0025C571D4|nr:hypothetical protein [Megasphaera sp. UBA4233]